MYRVEEKFCCTAREMYSLQRRLDGVLRADDNEHNDEGYLVSSLYFDDPADTCLLAVRDGCSRRRKYRIRIYNNSLAVIKLEVKEKLDAMTRKRSRQITPETLREIMAGSFQTDTVSPEDPAFLFHLAATTRTLRPKVIVAYERKAYLYGPGNVRITLDRHVRASRQTERFGTTDISYDALTGPDAVLEVKYDELLPAFLKQLLELNTLQQTSFSKYQLCRERYAGI